MHSVAMWPMRRRLQRAGYAVQAYSYPTMRLDLAENSARLHQYCGRIGGGRVHLVGHSMGGLVALQAAPLLPGPCRGRIVLLGTPFGESYAARALQRLPGGCALLGRSMGGWLAHPVSPALDGWELGVIAGSGGLGLGRVIARGLPQPHDGVIHVDETRVPGMRDHVVLPVSHTQMLVSQRVLELVVAFLRDGNFDALRGSKPSVN